MDIVQLLKNYLLIIGLIFPCISLVTCLLSGLTFLKTNRLSSPVLIPFIGPVLLTIWVLIEGRSLWNILAFWCLDIGTLAIIAYLPKLLKEFWDTSSFTQIKAMRGTSGGQNATITLHSTGCYLIIKTWQTAHGDLGEIERGELGTFSSDGDHFDLTSSFGLKRKLVRVGDSTFQVEESWDKSSGWSRYSLNGWEFIVFKT